MRKTSAHFWILNSALAMFAPLCPRAMATSEIPAAWPANRYDSMLKTSPFALATPVAPVATPGFASNLYLTGLAKIGDRDFVTIGCRDQQSRFSLFTGEQNADGVTLVSVEWSDAVGKSKVTVKKGTEFGTLSFDEATLQKPAQVTQPAPGIPVPVPQINQPPQRPVIPARTNQPLQPQPLPGANVPQRAPVIVQPAQATDARRRVRIINSKPQ